METIKQVLMRRDNLSEEEADQLIEEAKLDLHERLENGDFLTLDEICADWFGLEPDYAIELIDF